MKRKNHGLISLGLAAIAMAAVIYALFQQSFMLGILFLILAGISAPVILYAFCSKCVDRDQCGHVIAGPAAVKLFKNRKPGPYTAVDLILTSTALAVIFLFPQIWLWRHPLAFGIFWICMAIAAIDIRGKVCKGCGNVHCPGNDKFNK
jgi:hypothetical protein